MFTLYLLNFFVSINKFGAKISYQFLSDGNLKLYCLYYSNEFSVKNNMTSWLIQSYYITNFIV
ncbi:hypothetical protein FJ659_16775 [Bacillus dicomae]|uniref:Uncharacterized protein n=1 Tax=Bacillus dicomae TaxID=3088378 RepID=A0AC61T838_9BACI|nr:hypothetical protein FJ659_16775 [Bacillus dicomae]